MTVICETHHQNRVPPHSYSMAVWPALNVLSRQYLHTYILLLLQVHHLCQREQKVAQVSAPIIQKAVPRGPSGSYRPAILCLNKYCFVFKEILLQ